MNFLNFELFQQFFDMFVLEVAISKFYFVAAWQRGHK